MTLEDESNLLKRVDNAVGIGTLLGRKQDFKVSIVPLVADRRSRRHCSIVSTNRPIPHENSDETSGVHNSDIKETKRTINVQKDEDTQSDKESILGDTKEVQGREYAVRAYDNVGEEHESMLDKQEKWRDRCCTLIDDVPSSRKPRSKYDISAASLAYSAPREFSLH